MFSGVLALVERSLRVDARALSPHLARFGLMVAILISVGYATATSSLFGAPGMRFFRSTAYLNLVFLTLMGIGFFSTAISEEKEEDTLGLMLMAGINPLGILLGKSLGRLVQALLLIAVQYPFTLLAVTLGGVTQYQVRAVYVAMFAYMIMLAGLGLLCSTLARRNRTASMRLILVVAVYLIVPSFLNSPAFAGYRPGSFYGTIYDWIAHSSIFLQMDMILTTGFQDPLYSPQVATNLAAGFAGCLLSWLLFDVAVRDLSTDAIARGSVTRSNGPARMFSPGRPITRPFVWKDFHFAAGGTAALLTRIAVYVALYFVAIPVDGLFFNDWNPASKRLTGTYLFLTMLVMSLDAGLLVSRSLHQEILGQTLASLLMLPTTTARILYAKTFGTLLVWLPGPIFLFLGLIVLPESGDCVGDFLRTSGAPFWLLTHFVLIPHAAALAAMFIRWSLALAIGIAIGSLFLSVSFFEAISASEDSPIVFLVGFMILGACAACHVGVWLRAEKLAER